MSDIRNLITFPLCPADRKEEERVGTGACEALAVHCDDDAAVLGRRERVEAVHARRIVQATPQSPLPYVREVQIGQHGHHHISRHYDLHTSMHAGLAEVRMERRQTARHVALGSVRAHGMGHWRRGMHTLAS